MTSYKVEKVLSSSKDGKRLMVSVKFEGKTVTRHIIDGMGRHPDDSRPKFQSKLYARVVDLNQDIAKLEKAIAAATLEVERKGKDRVAAREAIPAIEARKVTISISRDAAVQQYETEVKENPLMVEYTD